MPKNRRVAKKTSAAATSGSLSAEAKDFIDIAKRSFSDAELNLLATYLQKDKSKKEPAAEESSTKVTRQKSEAPKAKQPQDSKKFDPKKPEGSKKAEKKTETKESAKDVKDDQTKEKKKKKKKSSNNDESPVELPKFDAKKILKIIDEYDEALRSAKNFDQKGGNPIPALSPEDISTVAEGYSHMMLNFRQERFGKKYGQPNLKGSRPIKFGANVPSYFANVGGETIFRRKELSIAGLANLVKFGPQIFEELRNTHFHGAPSAYSGDLGLNRMRRVTGNVVDLDTTVLRCSDQATLNVINMSNKHKQLPTFASTDEFAKSDQAQEIAISTAERLLEDFSKQLDLNEEEQRKRSIHLSQIQRPITVASDNSTRGHTPVWQYINAGQNSFHANVPTMDDVVGALLKAPFHCLRHYAFLHSGVYGDETDSEEMLKRVDDFFENCVVDSCFNMKWKAIEEYGEGLKHEGTIRWVLEQCQMRNQSEFTSELFDRDNEKRDEEIALMWTLVAKEDLFGKEETTGIIRKITKKDVMTWVRST